MMRAVFCRFLVLSVLLGGSGGCTAKAVVPPATTAHGYSVSFDVADRTLWLGPQGLGDPRPNMTTLIVAVHDSQGQGLDGIAVEFAAEPSWVNHVTIMPQNTHTQAGIARAIFDPGLTGVLHVMAYVDGQTYTRRLRVKIRNFGNSGGR